MATKVIKPQAEHKNSTSSRTMISVLRVLLHPAQRCFSPMPSPSLGAIAIPGKSRMSVWDMALQIGPLYKAYAYFANSPQIRFALPEQMCYHSLW
jgi:hypothetical protein